MMARQRGVAQEQEPLLDAEGAKEDAVVGVVLHRLWHEGGIGGGEVSCEVDGTGKSSPATGRKSRARLARSPCLKSITPPPPRTLCSVSSRDGCDWALQ